MDAHYDQVMKRRREADSTGRLYFAYSTILDRDAFNEWKEQHGYGFFELPPGEVVEAIDVDLTYDFPSRWWGGRVAGLVDKPGSSIFGRLFEIRGEDWPIIQHKEGAVTGMCSERAVKIRLGKGGHLTSAFAFTTKRDRASHDGPVSARFLEALIRGARSAQLPEKYIQRLEGDLEAAKG